MRNKLEEADDAFDEASVRAGDIEVLQAAGESKIVLNRLERALQRQQHPAADTACAEEDATAYLLNDIDEVTRRISTALGSLEHVNGRLGLSHNDSMHSDRSSTQTPMSPSSVTASSEDGNAMSTASSAWTVGSNRGGFSQRMSAYSESAHSHGYKSEEEKQVASSRQMAGPPSESAGGTRAPLSLNSDRWSNQFAYFDPMSVDIDSASSLILGRQPSPHPPMLMARSPARLGPSSVGCAPGPPETALNFPPDSPTRGTDGYVARSASLRAASLPVGADRGSRLSSIASLRRSAKSSTFPQTNRQSRSGVMQDVVTPSEDVGAKLQAPIQEQIPTSTYRAADFILSDLNSLQPPSSPLATHGTRIRDRILSRSAQAAKPRYRIVNLEKNDLGRTDSARVINNAASFSSSSEQSSPIDPGRRAFAGFTPSLYKIESLPTSHEGGEDHDGNNKLDSELDSEISNAIISSWNAGQWDQARHNLEILAIRHKEHHNSILSRRMEHLLGVIASINGELEVALAHFLAVFPVVIENASQLDVGHCAAACWMGDIYALLNRKTEAILAYSIAARTPLAEDPIWTPLQQQFLLERAACRSGEVKTGINFSVSHDLRDDEKAADSILDPEVIARDVARTIMQADNQFASREVCKLDANRSRAMALHDSGVVPGSWQERHKLEIDATAFEASQPWPLPFDPLFVLENVRRYRLSAAERDLLRSGLSAGKIPKKSRLAFSCQDLRWLIVTLRSCLTKLNIEWSEMIIDHGPRFLARYQVAGDEMASSHFFSIPIHRLSFRPGYGVDICSDGICSSRMQNVEAKTEKEVHSEEVKRVKKMVKEALDMAAKRQEATESKGMTLPVMSINGVMSLHRK